MGMLACRATWHCYLWAERANYPENSVKNLITLKLKFCSREHCVCVFVYISVQCVFEMHITGGEGYRIFFLYKLAAPKKSRNFLVLGSYYGVH